VQVQKLCLQDPAVSVSGLCLWVLLAECSVQRQRRTGTVHK
jgi:hypothetical protein